MPCIFQPRDCVPFDEADVPSVCVAEDEDKMGEYLKQRGLFIRAGGHVTTDDPEEVVGFVDNSDFVN